VLAQLDHFFWRDSFVVRQRTAPLLCLQGRNAL
jgi:hypothetical protein